MKRLNFLLLVLFFGCQEDFPQVEQERTLEFEIEPNAFSDTSYTLRNVSYSSTDNNDFSEGRIFRLTSNGEMLLEMPLENVGNQIFSLQDRVVYDLSGEIIDSQGEVLIQASKDLDNRITPKFFVIHSIEVLNSSVIDNYDFNVVQNITSLQYEDSDFEEYIALDFLPYPPGTLLFTYNPSLKMPAKEPNSDQFRQYEINIRYPRAAFGVVFSSINVSKNFYLEDLAEENPADGTAKVYEVEFNVSNSPIKISYGWE